MGRSVLVRTLAHLRQASDLVAGAACTQRLGAEADDIFPRSHGPESDCDPEAARQMRLSDKEIAFFKEFV